MKKILFVAAVIIFAGCASTHPTMAERPSDPSKACFESLANSTALNPLASKLKLSGGQPAFEMLADNSYPTEVEKPLIGQWVNERIKCAQQGEMFKSANMPPVLHNLLNKTTNQVNALATDLYSGKLTYGQFARQRTEINSAFMGVWSAELQRLAQNDERERRQAAMGMLLNQRPYQAPQMQPYQMPVPTRTNCRQLGNEVVCETR
jgi:hypothetical protein